MSLIDTRFVPADIDATDWSQIQPLLEELKVREVSTAAEFEGWIRDRSELDAACSEARARLYITMSCNTDNAAANAAFTKYVETIPPRLKPVEFELDRRHVSFTARFPLNESRYRVLNRSRRASVELFRDENVPIQTDLSKLTQEFDRIAGAQTVEFEGREQTLPQMARYLESPDRAIRESAWRAIAARRLLDRDALSNLYERMISLRHRMAKNAGFENYVGYAFREKERFDYTPRDCEAYWEAVEKHVVPLMRRLDERRRADLGVRVLRPWDLAVDSKGRGALRPFEGGRDLLNKTIAVFDRLDTRLGSMVKGLADDGVAANADGSMRSDCLDLDTRKGKRPGGYQYMRDRMRKPFIFMNAAGLQRDVMTMLHEAGHAFHSTLCAAEPLVEYRHSPTEFAEVASMSMEHLTMPHWGSDAGKSGSGFYHSPEDLSRARRVHLEDCITILAWIATIDKFQHWIYANPGHSRSERDAFWLSLDTAFGRGVSWTPGLDGASGEGLSEFRAAAWQRQPHLFSHPLYYIEYGIAQLGSLQLWLMSKTDGPKAAVDAYIRALSLGGSKPLPELFSAAGVRFDFGEGTVKRVADLVSEELEKLD